jgi:hypothetical protein
VENIKWDRWGLVEEVRGALADYAEAVRTGGMAYAPNADELEGLCLLLAQALGIIDIEEGAK